MTAPFDYTWGPGRLSGLGVYLQPDQASVADTEGYVLSVSAINDPLDECGACPLYDTDGFERLVVPVIHKTVLNNMVPYPQGKFAPRQELMDNDMGDDWRTMAKGVGEMHHGASEDAVLAQRDALDNNIIMPVWDSVMIDEATANRLGQQVNVAWNKTNWDALHDLPGLWQGWWDPEDDPERLASISDILGFDPTQNDPDYLINYENLNLVPQYELDPDLQKLWEGLKTNSKKHWQTLDDAMLPRYRHRYQWHDAQGVFSPWSS